MAVLCNDAERKEAGDEGEETQVETSGDSVEVALLELGSRAEMSCDELLEQMPRVDVRAFDPETKKMGTVHETEDGYLVLVKGTPLPPLPLQILYLNVLYDAFPALVTALGAEPFLFVKDIGRWWLSISNAVAAGAMIWMVFSELIPDALKDASGNMVAIVVTFSITVMLAFQ